MMASNPRFEESIKKNRIATLFLGIITSLSIIALLAPTLMPHAQNDGSNCAVSTTRPDDFLVLSGISLGLILHSYDGSHPERPDDEEFLGAETRKTLA